MLGPALTEGQRSCNVDINIIIAYIYVSHVHTDGQTCICEYKNILIR